MSSGNIFFEERSVKLELIEPYQSHVGVDEKMSLHSGGILLFRSRDDRLEVLLVHPGGPFWSKRTREPGRYLRGYLKSMKAP